MIAISRAQRFIASNRTIKSMPWSISLKSTISPLFQPYNRKTHLVYTAFLKDTPFLQAFSKMYKKSIRETNISQTKSTKQLNRCMNAHYQYYHFTCKIMKSSIMILKCLYRSSFIDMLDW